MPSEMFDRLRRNHLPFAYHFAAFEGGRLQDSVNGIPGTRGSDLLNKRVGALLARDPVTVPTGTAIRDAARTMRNERVSCVMITDGGALVGILTDRDLRNRVVAEGLSIDATVERVMTRDPLDR
ncbi:CBS domain-containing protein, partial [Pseudomonas aeruginosa]|uniref:CBS domain-containing protein n=1 Tax=Pseudomonas aeruginosa TaxID=287 RepID=UPI00396F71E1